MFFRIVTAATIQKTSELKEFDRPSVAQNAICSDINRPSVAQNAICSDI